MNLEVGQKDFAPKEITENEVTNFTGLQLISTLFTWMKNLPEGKMRCYNQSEDNIILGEAVLLVE